MTADISNCDDRPIGIFDSGIGGLTVMAELSGKLPHESIIYLGDTARVPYGDKSPETIIRYALEDAGFLKKNDVKLIIAACNTVSAVALDVLKKSFDVPVCGVLEAGAQAVSGIKNKLVVIGTKTTISSGAYQREIRKVAPDLCVECTACPLLVPLAEEGINNWNILSGVLDIYLGSHLKSPPDALLLGCTHYPLFVGEFKRFFSDKVKIISSATAAADMVQTYIADKMIKPHSVTKSPAYRFYVTDTPEKFINSATRFFGNKIEEAFQITL